MKRFKFSSLAVRLQMLVWVAVMPILLLIIFGSIWYRHNEEIKIRDDVVGLVSLSKTGLDRYINNTRQLLLTISDTDVIQKGNPVSISDFLREIHKHFPEHANFVAVDLKGNVFASAVPFKKPVNASDTFWFQQTMKTRDFTIGEYQIGRITGLEIIVFGQPVFDRAGNMKSLLAATMDIRWLSRFWPEAKISPDSHFVITDRNGTVLFHYPDNEKWVGKNRSDMPLVKAMLAQKEGTIEAACDDGIKRIYAITSIGSDIHMAIGISPKAAFKHINNILIYSLLALALVTLAGVLLARMFSRRFILKPINTLQDAASRVASGDYTSRTNLSDADNEIIAFADVFDKMAEKIEQEITERKKAEESLRESERFIKDILESVGEGFVVIDPEYKIISANRAYCEQTKLSCEDIVGRHCYEVSHHIEKPCFIAGEACAPRHTFKTGMSHMAIHTHFDKDGNPLYIETRSFPMKDDEGKVTAVIETLNNITEKRRLEEQLRHAQKMEAIGTLAGGIAHDFNNMLNVIIGYAGMMQMKMKPDDPQMVQLKEILAAGDRAAQLTRGLLAFSRKQVMEIKTVNLNEIVEGFKKMLLRIIGEDIDLKITLSEKDLIVKADIVQIEQVLMNLAANARDAMPKGGALTIETHPVIVDSEFIKTHGFGESGKYALITVSDTGVGMDEKTRERIFEPYFTTKEMGRGTGLRLAIVYGIVRQHNGYIDCYSEPGKGTTFKIYIPLVKAEAEEFEIEEAMVPKGGTETILIAEDDANVRGLIKHILESHGYTVIEAIDGEDAITKFKENKDRVQLLLFDLIMPKKNGKVAYEDIKAIRHDMKAVFMSGYAADIIKRFGIEEGVEFISKPVLPAELLRKVREELDKMSTSDPL